MVNTVPPGREKEVTGQRNVRRGIDRLATPETVPNNLKMDRDMT